MSWCPEEELGTASVGLGLTLPLDDLRMAVASSACRVGGTASESICGHSPVETGWHTECGREKARACTFHCGSAGPRFQSTSVAIDGSCGDRYSCVFQRGMRVYLVERNSLMPSKPPSRPIPDCFIPPKGAAALEMRPVFRPIIPVCSFSIMRCPR